jgi:p-hydroxybenzoate 3-monooxygenase
MRTTVGIIGAGPAGLLLARLLHNAGIDSVVLESRDREYVEHRQRAGILEQGTVDVLRAAGAGERMDREGLRHDGIELRFDRKRHRVDFPALTGGRSVTVYAQTEVCKDLIALQLGRRPAVVRGGGAGGGGRGHRQPARPLPAPGARGRPRLRLRRRVRRLLGRRPQRDPRRTDPRLRTVVPLRLARHPRRRRALPRRAGLRPPRPRLRPPLHALPVRLPSLPPGGGGRGRREWSDDDIWDELERRFETEDGWRLERGPITQKSVTPMRSYVHEPMRHGRLFLAGDAAHIVPPTGAKGLNLAVGDVVTFARALTYKKETGSDERLDGYSATCLRRVWQAERFSYDMTSLLHRAPDATPFEGRLQLARLERIASSRAAETDLAEAYTGFPLDEGRWTGRWNRDKGALRGASRVGTSVRRACGSPRTLAGRGEDPPQEVGSILCLPITLEPKAARGGHGGVK